MKYGKKKKVATPKPRPKRGDLNDLQASRDYNKYFKKKKELPTPKPRPKKK